MKKILFLTSNFPKVLDNGGKLRDYHIMKYLARKHELWVVGFNEPGLKKTDLSLPFVPAERCFTVGETRDTAFSDFFRLRYMPLWCLIYYAPEIQEMLDKVFKMTDFDCLHVSHSFMAHYALKYSRIKRVIDHHNVKTLLYRDTGNKTNNPFRKINCAAELYKWYRYQRQVLNNFEYHTACSGEEQNAIKEFVKAPVELLPSGVDTDKFYPKNEGLGGYNLLFTGSLDYFPNHEAVVYFCKQILPRVRRLVPEVVFQVVGRKPTHGLEQLLRRTANTWFSCDVRDIRPFYYQSTLFVVPLLDGAGTRLKIMEAMATGLPVVSTAKGCQGLGLKDGEGIIIRDDPQEMAGAIVQLLTDHEMRQKFHEKAIRVARENFSWDKVLRTLDVIYS